MLICTQIMDIVFFQEQPDDFQNEIGTIIEGSIPEWLKNGTFFKNGPGLFQVGNHQLNHFFDGYSKIQKFEFQPVGKIVYSSKFLETESYKKAMRNDSPYFSEFGTSVRPRNPFFRLLSHFHPFILGYSDNCNIAAIDFNDTVYVVGESMKLFKMNPAAHLFLPKTFEGLDLKENQKCQHFIGTCAHWQVDRSSQSGLKMRNDSSESGSELKMYGLAMCKKITLDSIFEKANQTLYYLDENDEPKILTEIPMETHRYVNYNHSFSVTPNFIIILRQPIAADMLRMFKMAFIGSKRGFADALTIQTDMKPKIIVICKTSGNILAQFETTEVLFTLHHVNCYEEVPNKVIILDCVCFTSLYALNMFFRDVLKTYSPSESVLNSRCKRFVMDMKNVNKKDSDPIMGKNVSTADVEFPCINDMFYGKEYQYMWCLCRPSDEVSRKIVQSYAIGRIDTRKSEENLVYWYEEGSWPSEPCFVPRNLSPSIEYDKNRSESDGVVLATIHCNTGLSYLLVCDAETMMSLAKVTWPNVTPGLLVGIHSMFVFPNENRVERKRKLMLAKTDTVTSDID
ncbi:beta,beta-carotene 15,15'-dioxygenase-like [Symsagittifera roscoffensis]|uniref:beta,beta-carotene 15,15'-dioxygenase-like n=1 Tax=Symsagittifera roscoffensis TaxID=84072 RepID=UPI00307B3F93